RNPPGPGGSTGAICSDRSATGLSSTPMVIDHRGQWLLRLGLLFVLAGLCALAMVPSARASIVPTGFRDKTILSGLLEPTAVAFAPDGRVFVAERSGVIKVFPSIDDPRATVVADLRTQVYNGGVDRGMLGLAVDPDFAQNHHIYVLYSYDAPI